MLEGVATGGKAVEAPFGAHPEAARGVLTQGPYPVVAQGVRIAWIMAELPDPAPVRVDADQALALGAHPEGAVPIGQQGQDEAL